MPRRLSAARAAARRGGEGRGRRDARVRVPGFRFAGVACGLKQSGKRDVALIVSDRPAVAAGAFTTNRVKAAPVVIGQERLRARPRAGDPGQQRQRQRLHRRATASGWRAS